MTETARAALNARQGPGARYDAPEAPADTLLLARRGTAFFARKLAELPDTDLPGPSRAPGISRARLVAAISYDARAWCHLLEALQIGKSRPLWTSEAERTERLDWGESLPPRALRSLFDHTRVHLDVTWRDLPGALWDRSIPLDGTNRVLRDTPLIRARHLWLGAIDLNNGARRADLPAALHNG
ncbi:maleylpyruvate isomerase N-terminal domain-containing protein [Antarctobacter jejuensis]|uniref:maleylpyruvate isomerase N-terminal domain-containing protein n=1 Tax=Antarctobacter jejuensis TaxID=1439938 RepID=UPI003FD25AFA